METETPRAVPLTAASLAMLESPEYGEDPSIMLLRRVLSSPHEMGDPNAPDDGDRRRSMELDAPLAGPSGASPASRASLDTTGSFVAYLAPRGASAADSTRFADAFAEKLGDGASRGVGARGAVAHERDGVATFVNRGRDRVVLFCGALTNRAALAADAFDDEPRSELRAPRRVAALRMHAPRPSSSTGCTTSTVPTSWTGSRGRSPSPWWTAKAPPADRSSPPWTAAARFHS